MNQLLPEHPHPQQITTSTTQQPPPTQTPAVPDPLPVGWVTRFSKSQPGFKYYFHQDTGECTWDRPLPVKDENVDNLDGNENATALANDEVVQDMLKEVVKATNDEDRKRKDLSTGVSSNNNGSYSSNNKRLRVDGKRTSSSSSSNNGSKLPKSVRVLHILKKHVKSRRPSSWRVPKITITKDKAIEDLSVLIEMLKEAEQSGELRETFEALAKTESDCSSYKKGGDLKEFTRGKMQPEFEKAAFALKIGEMSGIVESSSQQQVRERIFNLMTKIYASKHKNINGGSARIIVSSNHSYIISKNHVFALCKNIGKGWVITYEFLLNTCSSKTDLTKYIKCKEPQFTGRKGHHNHQ